MADDPRVKLIEEAFAGFQERDVEGLTYVVEGSFGHEDNVGGAFGPLPAGAASFSSISGADNFFLFTRF